MKRVLFVDDEANVLDGLRALLRKHRNEWDMQFANGGEKALALLGEQSFDIVVTDLRMPKVDGLTLLKYLRANHPHTVRIVLSGDPERQSALAVVPYAHQSLTKPCRLGQLEAVLARASVLGDLVADPAVRSAIGSIGELPPLPGTYARLVRVLDDENSSTVDVSTVIGSDIAVTAKILQLANSAFFGVGRSVTTVLQAIPLLGREALKCLTLSTGLFDPKNVPAATRAFAHNLHEHSSLVALLASELVSERERRDAFSAGMLHDVGRLVLAANTTEEQMEIRHAKVGGYLLALWGLPASVIDAVGHHHDESSRGSPIVDAIFTAEEILHSVAADPDRPTGAEVETMKATVAERVAKRNETKAA